MRIHLIIGPTGIGKTARAVRLALETGAPVAVLDRVQIYADLAVGSGRPLTFELYGTTRHYLTERKLCDGELLAEDALRLLRRKTAALAKRHDTLILEGGSISLLRAIWASDFLDKHLVQIIYLSVDDWSAYRQMLHRRAQEMLRPRPAITDELAAVWSSGNRADRRLIRTIVGYDVLLGWCDEAGVVPSELPSACRDGNVRAALASAVMQSHLAYAERQQAVFAALQRTHVSFAEEIVC